MIKMTEKEVIFQCKENDGCDNLCCRDCDLFSICTSSCTLRPQICKKSLKVGE